MVSPVRVLTCVAGQLAQRVAALTPVARRSATQIAAYAREWAERNDALLREPGEGGRLWVVLGDSAAQGVGASSSDGGYVGQLLARLGTDWQVVNLSRSGARTRDVVAQAREAAEAGLLARAALVTAVCGGNDLTRTPAAEWVKDARDLIAALPPGAVVATPPRGWRERKARTIVELVRTEAPAAGLRVADLWAVTGPPYRGRYADGFHPNELGYRSWTAALATALDLPAVVEERPAR